MTAITRFLAIDHFQPEPLDLTLRLAHARIFKFAVERPWTTCMSFRVSSLQSNEVKNNYVGIHATACISMVLSLSGLSP